MTHLLIAPVIAAATLGLGIGLRPSPPKPPVTLPSLALVSAKIGTAPVPGLTVAHPTMQAPDERLVRVVLASPFPSR